MLCNAWTEYKFTCVCVCVCVSVTLSVYSPTGQTPQQIFTVNSLEDADLRKDVPFGGIDLLLLVGLCVSLTIIGQPRNSVLIRRV